jgi:hypothetical protein
MLDEAELECVNHTFGCKHRDIGKKLPLHVPNCLHEQVGVNFCLCFKIIYVYKSPTMIEQPQL